MQPRHYSLVFLVIMAGIAMILAKDAIMAGLGITNPKVFGAWVALSVGVGAPALLWGLYGLSQWSHFREYEKFPNRLQEDKRFAKVAAVTLVETILLWTAMFASTTGGFIGFIIGFVYPFVMWYVNTEVPSSLLMAVMSVKGEKLGTPLDRKIFGVVSGVLYTVNIILTVIMVHVGFYYGVKPDSVLASDPVVWLFSTLLVGVAIYVTLADYFSLLKEGRAAPPAQAARGIVTPLPAQGGRGGKKSAWDV